MPHSSDELHVNPDGSTNGIDTGRHTPAETSVSGQFQVDAKGGITGIKGTSEFGNGVEGQGGTGVMGAGETGVHGIGDKNGVFGWSETGEGVSGDNRSDASPAVRGTNRSSGKGAPGVQGESDRGPGVVGLSNHWQGVYGRSLVQAGVVGESDKFDGVFGVSRSPTAAGVSGHNPGGMAGYFNGNVVVTGEIDFTGGADLAEHFDVGLAVEPGTVMVLGKDGKLLPCEQAYDKCVVGVVSGAGDFKPAVVLDRHAGQATGRQPIALLGKVYCKVDARYGSIGIGDLLTTSPTRGCAMKVAGEAAASGAIIGKALGSLLNGEGSIPVLVTLL